MNIIELARKAAALGDQESARRAYEVAVNDAATAPEEKLEAAAYILQNGGDYKISYVCFRDLYNAGHFQEDILPLMSAVFYEPNETLLRTRYERNLKLLEKYPYLFRRDFPAFEDLPIRFFPYDEHNGYIPFYRDTMLFGDYVNFDHPVVSRNFFKDLDKPILAAEVFSQYELEYLRDNVRRSDHIARENHVYLHYPDWAVFCAYLQVLNLRPLLKEEKLVFLIGDEIAQYPIDFKERFGIDYSQYSVKPVALREINKLIWHTQLSTHNGGDFFNEVFDAHPNLLPLTSIMLENMEEQMDILRDGLSKARTSGESKRELLRIKTLDSRVLQELLSIQNPTDKDIFAALYLSSKEIKKFLDPAARIVPAVFFQPHFSNINYKLGTDEKNRAVLISKQYEKTVKSPIFRGFKYIKTFTPMRRFTTSHAATVKFMWNIAQESAKKHREGREGKDEKVAIVSEAVSERALNRSFMVDWQDRLYKDAVVVRFEDGKLNPKATFTALAAFLDIPYTQSMTYCSLYGELDPAGFGDVRGFNTASVYKTYDDFANDSERKYLEYFLRDAYAFYGYDFQYYDGQPVTMERVKEWMDDFTTIDHYIRESFIEYFALTTEWSLLSDDDPRALEEAKKMSYRDRADEQVKRYHRELEWNTNLLMRGLEFVNRNGQPLHMTPRLELDPELLEQPLYH